MSFFYLLHILTATTSERGDPEKRPILTRIYGMVGCLIVSLALIALLIVLQKKLPSGAASNFHIPVRREVESSVLERQEDVLKGDFVILVQFP
jgi:hypothetical protein